MRTDCAEMRNRSRICFPLRHVASRINRVQTEIKSGQQRHAMCFILLRVGLQPQRRTIMSVKEKIQDAGQAAKNTAKRPARKSRKALMSRRQDRRCREGHGRGREERRREDRRKEREITAKGVSNSTRIATPYFLVPSRRIQLAVFSRFLLDRVDCWATR